MPSGSLVDYYGPPGASIDYEAWSLTLSASNVPATLPGIDWTLDRDGSPPHPFEVVNGPTSGTLGDGLSESLSFLPSDALVATPGLYEEEIRVWDLTYGTSDPVTHRAHVGINGFTLSPPLDFVGEGPGAPHGSVQTYTFVNRWIGVQDVTITPSPSASWMELGSPSLPAVLQETLPGKYQEAPLVSVPVTLNGSGLAPGVRTGTVTFATDACSEPECEQVRNVIFDHCREITPDLTLPEAVVLAPFGGEHSQPLTVVPTGGSSIIDDVDVAIDLSFPVKTGGNGPPFSISIVSPGTGGAEVLLKDFEDPWKTIYDDDTSPAAEALADLNGRSSVGGPWQLVFRNHPNHDREVELDLDRFEVRLHHSGALPCVP